MCSTDAQLVMRDAYETTVGIYNHNRDERERPLALVAFQPSEDTSKTSHLYERIRQFRIRNVPKHFGLSLVDFMSLPTDIAEFVLEEAGVATNEESTVAQNLSDQFKNLQRPPPSNGMKQTG